MSCLRQYLAYFLYAVASFFYMIANGLLFCMPLFSTLLDGFSFVIVMAIVITVLVVFARLLAMRKSMLIISVLKLSLINSGVVVFMLLLSFAQRQSYQLLIQGHVVESMMPKLTIAGLAINALFFVPSFYILKKEQVI